MKKLILLLGLVLGGGMFTSCDDFLDVNTDPNNPTTATPNFLLPNIISNGAQTQMFTALRTPFITQYLVARTGGNTVDNYFYTNAQSTNSFNYTYFYSGGNIPPMIAAAEAEGSVYYVGAGKIMMALILSHATDIFGDIPYTEAFLGAQNYTPKYDSQEEIYAIINRLLDEGIVEMSKPASANFRPLYVTAPSVSGDILYRGDVTKWIKLANSLKARQNHHLTKKASYDPNAILAMVDQGFKATADDAQLQFQVAVAPLVSTTNIFGTTRNNFATSTFSANFIKYLDGRTFGLVDPRLPIMATATSTGADPGLGGGPQPTTVQTDFYASWYARELGYFELITYHELKFIEAEAAFRANNRARAFTAFQEGIRAHMRKIGVGGTSTSTPPLTYPTISEAQITAYLASSAVPQSAADLTLKSIMEQKYIAMFLNPESWSDLRRFDFNPAIYVNFRVPSGVNQALVTAATPTTPASIRFPRRLLPGATEVLYNPNEIARIGANAPDYIAQPVWWDQP
ncbi:SusD/RagB family nutrient-binding outer membrane lipoprotein [Hymenobacter sp. HDW8]|uniref:SusD/RagB family nutrient-binding outer membrane lipoprotein n=1 Tax=Hymenobacter sp. HDW8 TaxID=2714932 RepID=UPI00140B8F0F|nr:SusD/RagB family nutrient-binding outer membrane lipoprotein [Hymenobacter sp. HDW8]QIL75550.1 SusD/RagB family nutrient-binding outer membrane lipoprotein [Hymenobacter sp. HDW8]